MLFDMQFYFSFLVILISNTMRLLLFVSVVFLSFTHAVISIPRDPGGRRRILDDVTVGFTANEANMGVGDKEIDSVMKSEEVLSDHLKTPVRNTLINEMQVPEYSTTVPSPKIEMSDTKEGFSTLIDSLTVTRESPILSTNSLSSQSTFEMTTDQGIHVSETSSPPIPSDNVTCHQECLSILDKANFSMTPNKTFFKAGSSLTLECSLPTQQNSSARLIWLFQSTNPPKRQCSLTPQKALITCNSFRSVDHVVDTNITSGYTREVVIIDSLAESNSGYYHCQVRRHKFFLFLRSFGAVIKI